MTIISCWKIKRGFLRKKSFFFRQIKKAWIQWLSWLALLVLVAALRTVMVACYMEEQAEASAPARWKTLQLLIQPLTCSLSCVCLNVNSDCVRPQVKCTAVTPRFCPHLLIPVHSVTVLHSQSARRWLATGMKVLLSLASHVEVKSFFSFLWTRSYNVWWDVSVALKLHLI